MRLRLTVPIGSLALYFSDPSAVEQFHVGFDTNGNLTVMRGSTTLGSVPSGWNVSGAIWDYFEIGATINGSTGSVAIKKNGQAILTLTNVNTQNSTINTFGTFDFRATPLNGNMNSPTFNVQHYTLCDNSGTSNNTFLGDVRVFPAPITANDAVQFTPTGNAANWQNVTTVPLNSGTDYNAGGTVGMQDTFLATALPTSLGKVFAVAVTAVMDKSDAGSRSAAPVVKSGTSVAVGTSLGLSSTPLAFTTIYETDPATGTAWTNAAASAAKPGYQVTA